MNVTSIPTLPKLNNILPLMLSKERLITTQYNENDEQMSIKDVDERTLSFKNLDIRFTMTSNYLKIHVVMCVFEVRR